jgi:cytochrome oxidase Cu insertion factor (SCO1/SenC/PrrC family)
VKKSRPTGPPPPGAGALGAGGPAVGDPAPDFDLPAAGGARVSLRALRGRPVVLFFYPKDDTPG